MKIVCCVCKKTRRDGGWVLEAKDPTLRQPVSHGYCPTCAGEAFAAVRREQIKLANAHF